MPIEDELLKIKKDIVGLNDSLEELNYIFVKKLGTGSKEIRGVVDSYVADSRGSFGGNGSDGLLKISSGTTTIDLANAAIVVKNYTHIEITGTAALAFSNPHANGTLIWLRSQGDVIITSSAAAAINGDSMGGAGGAGGNGGDPATNGTDGTDGIGTTITVDAGNGGVLGGIGVGEQGAGGSGGVPVLYPLNIAGKVVKIAPGAGGGSRRPR